MEAKFSNSYSEGEDRRICRCSLTVSLHFLTFYYCQFYQFQKLVITLAYIGVACSLVAFVYSLCVVERQPLGLFIDAPVMLIECSILLSLVYVVVNCDHPNFI